MKVLITGGNGFVGSHLAEALLDRNDDVTCLVRRRSNLRWLEGSPITLVYGDVTEPDSLRDAVRGQEVVFHLAGVLRGNDLDAYGRINADGTANLAAACRREAAPGCRFVYCSSLAAAGPSPNGKPRRENDPPAPITPYGRSKLAGEERLREVADGALPYTILRPPAIYGPRETDILLYFRLVRRGIAPIPGNGRQTFDLLYVRDLVTALLLAIDSPHAIGRTYFVNDGHAHTWQEVLAEIARSLGRRPVTFRVPTRALGGIALLVELTASVRGVPPALYRQKIADLQQAAWRSDASCARAELGFEPEYDIRRGIAETVRWYQEHQWL